MPESGLPIGVEQFIADHIRSVEHLEVFLAMAGSPDAKFSVGEIFAKVRSSEASVRERLEELASGGLVEKHGEAFQLRQDSEIRGMAEQLSKAYKERSIRVIQTIYSERKRAVQELSDAFRLRRKTKDG
jgi:hypothetical protein